MPNYINDIEHDEVRCGFLVTSRRKKIWQVELTLLVELDRICQKYGLKYYLDGGNMLGAVRHGGFIPWDDDIDVVMMRPDYERLKEIAPQEMTSPYFFQTPFTDEAYGGTIVKIRCNGTAAIAEPRNLKVHQGIFIDIWPLDAAPDGTPKAKRVYDIERELYMAAGEPETLYNKMLSGKTVLPAKTIEKLLRLTPREIFAEFERFALEHFDDSNYINGFAMGSPCAFKYVNCPKQLYEYEKRVPFETEGCHFPLPIGYEELLRRYYGNWQEIVQVSTHAAFIYSPDISYDKLLSELRQSDDANFIAGI